MIRDIPRVKVGRFWKYDLTGLRFGNWTALKETKERSVSRQIKWACKCDCGTQSKVSTAYLLNGHSQSCGCKKSGIVKGDRFGRLTTLSLSRSKSTQGYNLWNCLCDCGNRVRVRTASLNNGNTKSCGCLKINNLSGKNNYQAQRTIKILGEWISSDDPWYVRAVRIMSYSKRENIRVGFKTIGEFALHLREIAPKTCPVFGKRLTTGNGKSHAWSPSIDKIIPSKGYVRGNIQVISYKANIMKQDATPAQLKQFAQWALKEMA